MNKNLTIRLLSAFIIIFAISGILVLSNASKVSAQTTGGIFISVTKKTFTPFDILTIKGRYFDTNAAVSAIFTTKGGEIFIIPAASIKTTSIEVQIPMVAFNEAKGAFSRQAVSLKVIQIKEQGEKLAVKTSNEITGLIITAPRTPNFLKKAAFKNLPKGTLSKIFLSVSLHSLNSVADSISKNNSQLSASFKKSQDGLKDLISGTSKVIKNPKTSVQLPTDTEENLTLNSSVLARTDAVYSAYLGIAEKKKFIPPLLPESSDCMNEGLGDPSLSDSEKEMYGYICQPIDSAKEKLPIANKVAEIGLLFEWSAPQVVGGVMLSSAEIVMKTAIEVALAGFLPLKMDMKLSINKYMADASDALCKAIDDKLLGGGPILDQIGYLADTFVETGKYIYGRFANPQNYLGGDFFAIFAEPFYYMPNGFNPDARLIKFNYGDSKNPKVTVRQLVVPSNSLSLILDPTGILKGGFDVISNPTPTPPPSPTPTPEPEPEEKCTEPYSDTYHKCLSACDSINDLIEKSNCSNTCIGDALKTDCPW